MPAPFPRSASARVTAWAGRHVFATDAVWACLWFVLSVTVWPLPDATLADSAVYLALSAACCAVLSLRRIRPLAALAALAALLVVQVWWLNQLTLLTVVCALVAAYTAQSELPPWWRRAALAALLLGSAWIVFSVPDPIAAGDLGPRLASVGSAWTTLLLFSLLGGVRRRNRQEVERLREHAWLLQTHREQELRLAALAERTRIAREMHDVLAHSLNVMVAQADGGRYAAAADPGRAVEALGTIGRVGRESMRELHQLLGVLRAGEEAPGSAPVPGVGALPDLFEGYRNAGLDVRFVRRGAPGGAPWEDTGDGVGAETVGAPEAGPGESGESIAGDRDRLPASVSLTVHRIVQESLSNVLKHAGPVQARVELAWGREHGDREHGDSGSEGREHGSRGHGDRGREGREHRGQESITVTVVNPPGEAGRAEGPPGHGLTGMRERVALHGGTLEAGPDPATGGWRVHACLPWRRP